MAELYSWGEGGNGQLGNGATADTLVPGFISNGWSTISTSMAHVLGLKEDGTLWAWGDNSYGELGTGGANYPPTLTPTQVGSAADWARISAGRGYSLAIKADGTLWGWGSSYGYEFGNGVASSAFAIPTQLHAGPWSEVRAGDRLTQGIKADGSLWSCGFNNSGQLGINVSHTGPGEVNGAHRANFTREFTNATDWLDFPNSLERYQAGFARKTSGAMHAAGSSNAFYSLTYAPLAAGPWSHLATAFGYNVLGVKSDSTLWQLGWDLMTSTTLATPAQVGASSNWVGALSGNEHAGAYNSDGELYLWGWRVGDGTSNTLYTPTLVLDKVAAAWVGNNMTLALKTNAPPAFWTNFQSTREVL